MTVKQLKKILEQAPPNYEVMLDTVFDKTKFKPGTLMPVGVVGYSNNQLIIMRAHTAIEEHNFAKRLASVQKG